MQAQGHITIESLHEDILYEILLIADQLDPGFKLLDASPPQGSEVNVRRLKPTARVCSEVSTHWQRLISGWPRCWAMSINLWNEYGNLVHQTTETLSTSQGCDLDVWMFWHSQQAEDLIPLLVSYAKQMRLMYHGCYGSPSIRAYRGVLQITAAFNPSRLTHWKMSGLWDPPEDLHLASTAGSVIPYVMVKNSHISPFFNLRIQVYHLEVWQFQSTPQSFAALLESLGATRKLCLAINAYKWEEGQTSSILLRNRAGQWLRALRIEGNANAMRFYFQVLCVESVSKLSINLISYQRSFIDGTYPQFQNKVPKFEHLVEIDVTIDGRDEPWFWEMLRVLPWSQIQKVALKINNVDGLLDSRPIDFLRTTAERLTHLRLTVVWPSQLLFLLGAWNLPVLADLFIGLQPPLGIQMLSRHALTRVDCPQLSQIAIYAPRAVRYISDLTELVDHIHTTSLTQLDLSRVEFREDDYQWEEAWSSNQANLIGLKGLSVPVPNRAQGLKLTHCFKSCKNIRILSMVLGDDTSFDVLALLRNPDPDFLQNLETLQLRMLRLVDIEKILEMKINLEQLVLHRKLQGISLKELGILLLPDQKGVDGLLDLSSVVQFVLGDVSERAFPQRLPIDDFSIWNSW